MSLGTFAQGQTAVAQATVQNTRKKRPPPKRAIQPVTDLIVAPEPR